MHYSSETNAFYPSERHQSYKKKGTWPSSTVKVTGEEWQLYGLGQPPIGKQRGSDEAGRPCWVDNPETPIADLATMKRREIEIERKAAETQGVEIRDIRYAGDPGNRQAIMEVLELVTATGQESIASWKDSDGRFHANHPVADVREALMAIATRRGELISREGELNALINTAEEVEDREALEAIEWSNAL